MEIRPHTDPRITDGDVPAVTVHTYPDPADPHVRIANIYAAEPTINPPGYVWKKLVDRWPMTHEAAMEFAQRYAAEHQIEVIYEQKS